MTWSENILPKWVKYEMPVGVFSGLLLARPITLHILKINSKYLSLLLTTKSKSLYILRISVREKLQLIDVLHMEFSHTCSKWLYIWVWQFLTIFSEENISLEKPIKIAGNSQLQLQKPFLFSVAHLCLQFFTVITAKRCFIKMNAL